MKTIFATCILVLASLSVRAAAADLPTFPLQAGDITRAAIVLSTPDHATLDLTLTPQKRDEFTRFTTENHGKKVSITISGAVVAEPVVRDTIQGDSISIVSPSPEKALAHARSLLKSKP